MDEEKDRSGCRRLEDIEDRNVHHILAQHVEHSTEYDPKRYEHIVRFRGSFNLVFIWKVLSGKHAGSYAVKIPQVGTAARWQEQDAYMLRSEYGTMKLIQESTKCLIPEVLAYDDRLENDLGAPFIITRACPRSSSESNMVRSEN